MEQREDLFLLYIRYTFKRWAGFQAAVNSGMGGPYSKEKEEWIGNEVANYFMEYNEVYPDDIENYLGAMIENEFDTYFEDGSLREVSSNICLAFRLSKENPSSELFKDVYKPIQLEAPIPIVDSESEEESPCEKMEELTVNDPEEDGWTKVTKKNKKIK